MPNQSTPEIDRLTEEAAYIGGGCSYVGLEQAIQAVRDTEDRVRGERVGASGGRPCPECGVTRWEAKQADGWVAEAVERRTHEIVEALRGDDAVRALYGTDHPRPDEWEYGRLSLASLADFISRAYLNEEGNDA